jgi:dipeptidyl aminopeptidase/acylaminoacyl peptidase
MEPGGDVRALTAGAFEVRAMELSRDRSRLLIGAGREHPCDDHLYSLPATGGELTRLTEGEGRFVGALSPDGARLALVHGRTTQLPDLFLTDARPGAPRLRITASGTDELRRHPLLRPEVVSFPHPDGKPVWGALYEPIRKHPSRAAVLHIHGGGYRQFSHRGYSVYGWAIHLGFLHWLVEQGVTVLDLDYRGSAGFGRDYRTDIYRSMGEKDVEGGLSAIDYLVREHDIDRSRVGVYGISYGGFFTLMALFRHPGVFAAGVANAAVTDWAHYEHDWTSRILGLPTSDPEAYRRSSPIEHVDGLRDPLLIVHGLVDDNVQFQDASRLVQKLIEREKDFEVAIYPVEPHTMESEASRYDYARRMAAFFSRHLLAPR